MMEWGWCTSLNAFQIEIVAGIFCLITWKLAKLLFLTPWTAYQMWGIEKKYGLAEPTVCSFLCERLAMLIEFVLIWVPIALLIAWLTKVSGGYLALVFLFATGLVKVVISWLYPLLI